MYLVLLLPFYKISTKESLGVRKPKGHLSWPWCFCNEEKRAAAQKSSHCSRKWCHQETFSFPNTFVLIQNNYLRLGYRIVENYCCSLIGSWLCSIILLFFVSFFFCVYLSIEDLPFTIQSRSDDSLTLKVVTYHKSLIVKRRQSRFHLCCNSDILSSKHYIWWNFSFFLSISTFLNSSFSVETEITTHVINSLFAVVW